MEPSQASPDDADAMSENLSDDPHSNETLNSSLPSSTPSPLLPMIISPTPPPDTAHLIARRTVALLRTLALRNIEIGRKYAYRAAPHVQRWVQQTAGNLGTTVRSLRYRLQAFLRRLGPGIDNALLRLQASLERSDSAVIWFTLFLIVACILLTLLLWNLI